MIVHLFELIVILTALVHSRFARLPLMVAINIMAFSCVKFYIESNWEVTISPGYEIYYIVGSIYFLIMAVIFLSVRNKFYGAIGLVLVVQSIASTIMLVSDNFYLWHEEINDKMLFIECLLVWISSVRSSNEKRNC